MKNLKLISKAIGLHSFLMMAALALICSTPSCNCDPNAPAPADYRIKTMKEGDKSIETYTYDAQNRVKTIEEGNNLTTYDYLENPKRVEKRKNGALEIRYLLNNEGYMINDGQNGSGTQSAFIYTYNTAGNIVKQEPAPGNSGNYTYEYTWDDKGNLTELKLSYNASALLYTYEYSDKTDTRIDGMDWFYGKRTKNLQEKLTSPSGNLTFSYQFDARGRVIQQVSSTGLVTAYTYFN